MAKRRSTRRGGYWSINPLNWGKPDPVPTGTSSPMTSPPPPPTPPVGGKKRKTRRGGRHRRGKSHKIYGTR